LFLRLLKLFDERAFINVVLHDSLVLLAHGSWQGGITHLAGLRHQESAALVVVATPLMAKVGQTIICGLAN
jgi:hypothetical protein